MRKIVFIGYSLCDYNTFQIYIQFICLCGTVK